MDKKELVRNVFKTRWKEFSQLSTLEYLLFYKLKEASEELIKPTPISWSAVYIIGSTFYLSRKDTKRILKSLALKGFIRIKRSGIVVIQKPPMSPRRGGLNLRGENNGKKEN